LDAPALRRRYSLWQANQTLFDVRRKIQVEREKTSDKVTLLPENRGEQQTGARSYVWVETANEMKACKREKNSTIKGLRGELVRKAVQVYEHKK